MQKDSLLFKTLYYTRIFLLRSAFLLCNMVFKCIFRAVLFFVLPDNVIVVIFLILVFVCFVTTTWSSYKIYLTVRHHNIQIQATVQQVSENNEVVKIANTRSARSTLLIYLAFWVCYLPRCSILIARQNQARKSVTVDILNMFSLTLVLLNSSVNPIIYCWTMRHIRHTIVDILRNMFRGQ